MDTQMKKGLVEVCVLKVLSLGDSYGYQIIKDVSPYIEISESTLYPILKRFEGSNMLTVYTVEHNSRLRKYYKITDEGKKRIDEFLDDWQEVLVVYNFIKGNNEDDDKE